MSAYVIGQLEVFDPERYQDYLSGFMPIFERHGGELLATSAKETHVVEGVWSFPKTVLMRFPDMASARAWLNDPDYKSLCEHRHASANANLVVIEGVD